MEISAVIVTRGNVDLEQCIEPIKKAGITDIVIWNNSLRQDVRVLGRYWAARECVNQTVYTQDDDAICPVKDILKAYKDDELMVNVPEDEDRPWLSWGAVFKRGSAFKAFFQYPSADMEDLYRWPDVIFAEMTPHRRVDLGHENLPWATGGDRMYRMKDHESSQHDVREKCRALLEVAV